MNAARKPSTNVHIVNSTSKINPVWTFMLWHSISESPATPASRPHRCRRNFRVLPLHTSLPSSTQSTAPSETGMRATPTLAVPTVFSPNETREQLAASPC
ncbi:hypothetical protein R5R35_003681 [Gryllus longicercus]|uniref:Uncharacterized protein n=1 Tax=Gryllus longicercus TaxID=2509291 RepID=A0AAN9YXC6_9ORTH